MLLVFVGLALTPAALAQQPTPQPPPFIQPSRPLVSTPAEVQKAGVLQVEYGYDAFFRSRDFSTQQATPLRLRFAASSRLLLDFDFQPVKSQTPRSGARDTGVGDVRVGFQAVAIKGADKHPALAFAYFAKLPAASAEKGLGSGRVDHSVRALLFALGALVYRVNRRFRLDGGMRFGLNPDAPRAGVFVGTTVGAADLFKGRK
ncbi:MAG: transporter [Acidobacteria bacterium]|nr:transporter [Acidobacteriota bacterium]